MDSQDHGEVQGNAKPWLGVQLKYHPHPHPHGVGFHDDDVSTLRWYLEDTRSLVELVILIQYEANLEVLYRAQILWKVCAQKLQYLAKLHRQTKMQMLIQCIHTS